MVRLVEVLMQCAVFHSFVFLLCLLVDTVELPNGLIQFRDDSSA